MHTVSRCSHSTVAELKRGVQCARRYLPLSRPALAASAAPVHTVSRYGHEPLLSSTDAPEIACWRKLINSLFSTSFLVPKPPVPSMGHPFKLESMLFSLKSERGSCCLLCSLPWLQGDMQGTQSAQRRTGLSCWLTNHKEDVWARTCLKAVISEGADSSGVWDWASGL